ncbi:glycosyltransferase [Sporolactobacillus sp. CPB3-1]|uniref:Glycosyltransferase n=1 Tax=Sporolactobacillus mangiferae TaxID=2940498 RepID=A0ABT0M9Z3_9BACL|nr:glycosyltransferase [Sporolactobacillus mangiferae]MCL1631165.1 glycosyltransferase [Sporolactobacillus mangiferae]
MISILILSYNAPIFTKHTLTKLQQTKYVEFEVIVLDNNSNIPTKKMLIEMKKNGYIDKLILETENKLFAKGNNIAFQHCSPGSDYVLLLNSDIDIRDDTWLSKLFKIHKKGATAYGVCENNPVTRGDGFCFLIDKDLYAKYKLDEEFEWWWAVTKLQAQLLNNGFTVTAVRNFAELLHHYGGMSGQAWKTAKGMKIEGEKIKTWYDNAVSNPVIIDKISGEKNIYSPLSLTNVVAFLKNINKKIFK